MSEEKKVIELNDEDLEQVSGGTRVPDSKIICSRRLVCPYTSKSECTLHNDVVCKYDN